MVPRNHGPIASLAIKPATTYADSEPERTSCELALDNETKSSSRNRAGPIAASLALNLAFAGGDLRSGCSFRTRDDRWCAEEDQDTPREPACKRASAPGAIHGFAFRAVSLACQLDQALDDGR